MYLTSPRADRGMPPPLSLSIERDPLGPAIQNFHTTSITRHPHSLADVEAAGESRGRGGFWVELWK